MTNIAIRNNPITLRDCNEAQFKAIQTSVEIDDLKKEYRKERTKLSFNIQTEISFWLDSFSSPHTKRMYLTAITNFLKWSHNEIVDISRREALTYLKTLEEKSPNTIRFYLAGISSFYTHLIDFEYLEKNPFNHIKNKNGRKTIKDKYIPSQTDVEKLYTFFEENMKVNTFKKMKLSMKLLNEYGVRKGFLDNAVLVEDKIVSTSKGKEYSIKISEKDLTYFEECANLLGELNSNTFSIHFNKAVAGLVNEGEIAKKFSPHCLRHKYAIEKYVECRDLVVVKNLLNHSNVGVTEIYLKGLGVYEGE